MPVARLSLLLTLWFAFAGLASAGDADLDPSFAPPLGVARFDLSATGTADRLAGVENVAGGKLLLIGQIDSTDGFGDLGLMRLGPDGSRDMTYGVDGFVRHSLAGGKGRVHRTALQSDGHLLVAGSMPDPDTEVQRGALLRIDANGVLDQEFAATSVLRGLNVERVEDVLQHPDGSLFVVASLPGAAGVMQVAVIALTAKGTLRTAFGVDGVAHYELYPDTTAPSRGAALQLEPVTGKLMVGGDVGPVDGRHYFGVLRIDAQRGELDPRWGKRGRILVGFDTCPDPAVTEQATLRKIVAVPARGYLVAGTATNAGCAAGDTGGFALMKLEPRGYPETGFGDSGRVLLRPSQHSDYNQLEAVALDAHGDVLLVGRAGRVVDRELRSVFAVARVLKTGLPDAAFSEDGVALYDLASGGLDDGASALAARAGQHLVLGSSTGSSLDFAAVRLMAVPLRADGFEE
jgi:uncharacterized delta-60 repeat protein